MSVAPIYLPAGLLGKSMPAMYLEPPASGAVEMLPARMLGRNTHAMSLTGGSSTIYGYASDSYALSDSFTAIQIMEWGDAFAFASAFSYVQDVDEAFSDSFAFADQFRTALQLSIADAFSFSDTISLSRLALAIADAFSLDDSFAARIEAGLSMSDAFSLDDSLFHALGLGISDAFALADSFVAAVRAVLSLSDSFAMSDSFASQAIFSFILSDGFGMDDEDFVPRLEAALQWGDSFGMVGFFALSEEEKYLAWVVNTRTGAPYKFQSFPYNSFGTAGGKVLGCAEDGIYEITGDTDDGEAIGAYLKTGFMDFGSENEKRIDEAFLAYSAQGETLLKIIFEDSGAKTESWYRLSKRPADVTRNAELSIHRGIESVRFQFEIHALDGKPARYKQLTLLPVITHKMT